MTHWSTSDQIVTIEKTQEEVKQENSTSEQVIELEYQNAKERLNTQRETIKSLSEEGARYLRLLLILIGVPIAVLGVFEPATLSQITTSATSNRCFTDLSGFCMPMKFATSFGSFTLFLSLMMNITAGGFEAYGTQNIINPDDISRTTNSEESFTDHLSTRLEEYEERIRHNDKVIFTLDVVLGAGKSLLLASILTLGLLSYRLLVGSPLSAIFLTSTLLFVGGIFVFIQYLLPEEFTESRVISKLRFLYSQSGEQEDSGKKE